jgi:L-gulonate 3-dehydrogenase
MSKVAIIGSGFVGRAWAISFSRAGHDVALWDQDPQAPEKALTDIRGLLPDLAASDLLNGAAAQAVEARMRPAAALEAALEGAVHVKENTPEDVEVKRKVFAQLDAAAAPEAVLASSTSAILPSAFTETLKGRAASSFTRSIRLISSRPPKSSRPRGRTPRRSSAPLLCCARPVMRQS